MNSSEQHRQLWLMQPLVPWEATCFLKAEVKIPYLVDWTFCLISIVMFNDSRIGARFISLKAGKDGTMDVNRGDMWGQQDDGWNYIYYDNSDSMLG